MLRRCSYPSHNKYSYYGALGIRVCDRWLDFDAFVADVGPRPSPKHSIDRYPDPYGNYEPGNTRWADPYQQANNRRAFPRAAA